MQKVGQPYGREPLTGTYDAIVIGSGIGGMTTAALLAKHAGRRVLLLERHYTAGGFTHVFRRPEYEWDVGVHYIGEVHNPRSLMRRLFDHITGNRLQWEFMGDVYDRICIGDETYDLVAGRDRFRAQLTEYFPEERTAIDRYVDTVHDAVSSSRPYFAEKAAPAPLARLAGRFMRSRFLSFATRTTRSVLEGLTKNPELIGVLSGQCGDYGLPPGRSSFAIHAMVAHHYFGGASYPVGGASEIAAGVAPVIEEAGGRILVNAEVQEIVVENGRAVGVRMVDGSELRAPMVISDAGIANTFLRLLSREVAERHRLPGVLEGLESSAAHVCLYVGLKHTDAELGLSRANLWLYPGYDHDANFARYLEDPDAPFPLVYVSFPSAKDPTWPARHPGTATIELLTLAPYEWFDRWAGGRWKHRGADYEELKERFAQRMLEVFFRRLPQVRGKIDYYELSTPLTTRHFANYQSGEIYGLAHTPERFRRRSLGPRTPIRQLYLTGQDVATCGIGGALMAGVLTASAILGRNMLRVVQEASSA